jgi:hypothetical protein
LKEDKDPFVNIGFTHDTSNFNLGIFNSSYKILPTMKDKVELGRAVLDSDVLATVHNDTLNKNFSNDSLEEGVVLLATREDDGSFAIRRVVQSNAAVKSALAACASVGQDKERAKQFEEEQKAIEAERLAAQAALKVA